MAVSNIITKGASIYTVYTATGIAAGVTLYTTSALTTVWTANYGSFWKITSTNNDYCDIDINGVVTTKYYGFKTFDGGSTLYTIGPLAVNSIVYKDLLYFNNPLIPETSACSNTTNYTSEDGLTMIELECSTGKVVKIRTAPFVFFNRFEPTIASDVTSRNSKVGCVYDIIAATGYGGTPPFSVTTGAGVNFSGFSAGEIKFDDWRKNTTRNATFRDSDEHTFIQYIPTVQYIADPAYYTVTFNNGTMDVVFNDIWNEVYDQMVTIEYQVSIIYEGVIVPWTTETTFTDLPLRDLQLQIRDEFGSYLKIDVPYVEETFQVNFNKIQEADSASQSDKNNKVSYVYNISGGTPPYSLTTLTETFTDLSSGPTIEFDYERNNEFRAGTFSDSGTNNANVTLPTVQIVANSTYFTNYTFTNEGVLTIIPNYDLNVDILTIPQYRIQDIESGQYLSNWQTTPTFSGLPTKNVYLEVNDNFGSYLKVIITFIPGDVVNPVTELGDISFTNDPMVVIVDSSIKNSQNMKYLYTMFDKDSNVILKTSVYPDIENNYLGIYNMNMIYNNYVTTECNFDIDNIVVTDNVYQYSYNINDGSISSGITSDIKYCMKGGTVYGENFIIDNYIGEPSYFHKFITKWEGRRMLRTDDYGIANYLNGNFTDVSLNESATHIAFVKYTIADQPHEFVVNDSFYHDATKVNYIPLGIITKDYSNKLLTIPYGTKNFTKAVDLLNVVDADDNVMLTNILLDSDTTFYEVHLVQKDVSTFTKFSESIIVDLNKTEMCSKYEPTRFIWLDMYGNYNTFTFNGLNVKEFNLDRNSVNNDYFGIQTDGKWGYQVGDRGRKTVNIKKTQVHQANSGWLNNDLSKNLMDLYSSSDIYVIINDEIYPIVVTTNNVEEKNISNNRLFNHTISYEMAYDINTNE